MPGTPPSFAVRPAEAGIWKTPLDSSLQDALGLLWATQQSWRSGLSSDTGLSMSLSYHFQEISLIGSLIVSPQHDGKKLLFLSAQGSGSVGGLAHWATQSGASRFAHHGGSGLASVSSDADRRVCQERRFPPLSGMVFPPLCCRMSFGGTLIHSQPPTCQEDGGELNGSRYPPPPGRKRTHLVHSCLCVCPPGACP